ncbi:MAG: hypothetical protein ACYTA3_11440 [Planctomycetota bacterium]
MSLIPHIVGCHACPPKTGAENGRMSTDAENPETGLAQPPGVELAEDWSPLDHALDPIQVVDGHGHVAFVNQAWCKALRVERTECEAQAAETFIAEGHRDAFRRALELSGASPTSAVRKKVGGLTGGS